MGFVDGQNLFQHAKAAFGHHHPNYDPLKLHQAVCAARGWESNLVRFYTGVPEASRDPDGAGYWSSRVIAMNRAGIAVTTRKLRYRAKEVPTASGETQTVWTPQEKGIDVRLALDIVKYARLRNYNAVVIYSQDQDLAEVVQEIKEIAKEQKRFIHICCAFPVGPYATSSRGIDSTDWFKMDEAFYNACLDPRDYRPHARK
jgi:uncharacterized LabA/DUF88 family protein